MIEIIIAFIFGLLIGSVFTGVLQVKKDYEEREKKLFEKYCKKNKD